MATAKLMIEQDPRDMGRLAKIYGVECGLEGVNLADLYLIAVMQIIKERGSEITARIEMLLDQIDVAADKDIEVDTSKLN